MSCACVNMLIADMLVSVLWLWTDVTNMILWADKKEWSFPSTPFPCFPQQETELISNASLEKKRFEIFQTSDIINIILKFWAPIFYRIFLAILKSSENAMETFEEARQSL